MCLYHINARSPQASLPFKGQANEQTTVKKQFTVFAVGPPTRREKPWERGWRRVLIRLLEMHNCENIILNNN